MYADEKRVPTLYLLDSEIGDFLPLFFFKERKKNIRKSSIGILVCLLLLGPMLVSVCAVQPNDEILDLSTRWMYVDYLSGNKNNFLEQSFKPTLSSLSKWISQYYLIKKFIRVKEQCFSMNHVVAVIQKML